MLLENSGWENYRKILKKLVDLKNLNFSPFNFCGAMGETKMFFFKKLWFFVNFSSFFEKIMKNFAINEWAIKGIFFGKNCTIIISKKCGKNEWMNCRTKERKEEWILLFCTRKISGANWAKRKLPFLRKNRKIIFRLLFLQILQKITNKNEKLL